MHYATILWTDELGSNPKTLKRGKVAVDMILPFTKENEELIIEIARKVSQSEEIIAAAWAESYKDSLMGSQMSNISEIDFLGQVRLFLTSLADGNFPTYFDRIEKKGLELAVNRESYENVILSFHLYEDATAPHLKKLFPECFHNVIAILARAYFAELEREKEKFINILAHDLKTPLTAIMLMAQTLWKQKLSPVRQTDVSEKIWRAGKAMSELIDSMLEYGKLKTGRGAMVLEEVDIVAVIKDAAIILMDNARERQLDMTINKMSHEQWGDLPRILIKADHSLIGRACNNYLSNAIKHARTKILIEIREEQNDVEVSVQDDGSGIPERHLKSVFDDYFVIPDAKAGTGLGLPSVRMISQLHQGKCWVESEIGVGSRFYLSIPKIKP